VCANLNRMVATGSPQSRHAVYDTVQSLNRLLYDHHRIDKMSLKSKPAASFISTQFDVLSSMADDAAGILVANGALGCSIKAPFSPRPRNSKVVCLEAFFDRITPSQMARIESTLAAAGMLSDSRRRTAPRRIVDPGWATQWKRRFTPLRIGRRLLITPPWKEPAANGRLKIIIEPAQAFGTGHHPTTRGMLTLIESECAARQFENALDVGTGSGVLAIAMKRLGLGGVTGIDNDPVAIESAHHNAKLNGLERHIAFATTPLASLRRRYDLIAANITAGVLIACTSKLRRLLAADGRLILSGMLASEVQQVKAAYQPELRCVNSRIERGWATLVMGR